MANFNEQVEDLWDEWIAESGQESGDPGDFVDWAMAQRRLVPRPQDLKQLMRKQVTQVLRQAKRVDPEDGFTYRAKQSVILFEGETPIRHYFDTDTGGTSNLRQKSVKQRREAVAHDIYRGFCDTERMRKLYPEEQLTFFPDFTDDMAELRAVDVMGRNHEIDDEEAA
jgi:hypothetical protein